MGNGVFGCHRYYMYSEFVTPANAVDATQRPRFYTPREAARIMVRPKGARFRRNSIEFRSLVSPRGY